MSLFHVFVVGFGGTLEARTHRLCDSCCEIILSSISEINLAI